MSGNRDKKNRDNDKKSWSKDKKASAPITGHKFVILKPAMERGYVLKRLKESKGILGKLFGFRK